MSEFLTAPKPYEREHAEIDRVLQRFDVVVDVLGFEEPEAAADARDDLIRAVGDGHFDSENQEHRALLSAYQIAAEESVAGDDIGAGYQLALAALWVRLDDPDRFYDRLEAASDLLFYNRLDAALAEVNAITNDLESLNRRGVASA